MSAFISGVLFALAWLAAVAIAFLMVFTVIGMLWTAVQTVFYFLESLWDWLTSRAKGADFHARDAGDALKATIFLVVVNLVLASALFGLSKTEGGQEAFREDTDGWDY